VNPLALSACILALLIGASIIEIVRNPQ